MTVRLRHSARYVHGIFQNAGGKQESQPYTFLHDFVDLKIGDFAVVETSNGYGVIQVTSLEQKNKSGYKADQLRWVIDIVDMSAHLAKKEARDRLELLEVQLNQRVSELMEAKKFEMLEQDPVSAELVKEFKQLQGIV